MGEQQAKRGASGAVEASARAAWETSRATESVSVGGDAASGPEGQTAFVLERADREQDRQAARLDAVHNRATAVLLFAGAAVAAVVNWALQVEPGAGEGPTERLLGGVMVVATVSLVVAASFGAAALFPRTQAAAGMDAVRDVKEALWSDTGVKTWELRRRVIAAHGVDHEEEGLPTVRRSANIAARRLRVAVVALVVALVAAGAAAVLVVVS